MAKEEFVTVTKVLKMGQYVMKNGSCWSFELEFMMGGKVLRFNEDFGGRDWVSIEDLPEGKKSELIVRVPGALSDVHVPFIGDRKWLQPLIDCGFLEVEERKDEEFGEGLLTWEKDGRRVFHDFLKLIDVHKGSKLCQDKKQKELRFFLGKLSGGELTSWKNVLSVTRFSLTHLRDELDAALRWNHIVPNKFQPVNKFLSNKGGR